MEFNRAPRQRQTRQSIDPGLTLALGETGLFPGTTSGDSPKNDPNDADALLAAVSKKVAAEDIDSFKSHPACDTTPLQQGVAPIIIDSRDSSLNKPGNTASLPLSSRVTNRGRVTAERALRKITPKNSRYL